jgi:hypothetical protein
VPPNDARAKDDEAIEGAGVAGAKRKVTRECLDPLAALLAAVESGPQPVR